MSQRVLTLCDFNTGTQCTSAASEKCPLCDRDACAYHFGVGFAVVSLFISVSPNSKLTHGGHTRLHACAECIRILERAGAQDVGDVATMLRARCAAVRLGAGETEK